MCNASASTITSFDLGILEPPKAYLGEADEMEMEMEMEMHEFQGYPLYVAPRRFLWLADTPSPLLSSLTRLLLCKRGQFDGPPDMSEDGDFEIREEEGYELMELK